MNYEEAKLIPISAVREKLGHGPDHLPNCEDAVEYVQAHLKLCKEDHTRVDAVRWLNKMFPQQGRQELVMPISEAANKTNGNEWHIVKLDELEDLALLRYLQHRGIDVDLAKELLQGVYLHNNNRSEAMYVLGFPNEDGGFALLGPFINSLIGRRAISVLRRGNGLPNTIHVFADFMDMLAALSAFPALRDQTDIICLNSPELLSSGFSYISGFGYSKLYSWFPNSPKGIEQINKLTGYAKTDKDLKHLICNYNFRGYEDVASWHKAKSRTPK